MMCQLADTLPHFPSIDRKIWIGRKQKMLKESQICYSEGWHLTSQGLANRDQCVPRGIVCGRRCCQLRKPTGEAESLARPAGRSNLIALHLAPFADKATRSRLSVSFAGHRLAFGDGGESLAVWRG